MTFSRMATSIYIAARFRVNLLAIFHCNGSIAVDSYYYFNVMKSLLVI
jgi:hypothetical protein